MTDTLLARYIEIFGVAPAHTEQRDPITAHFFDCDGTTYAVSAGLQKAFEVSWSIAGKPGASLRADVSSYFVRLAETPLAREGVLPFAPPGFGAMSHTLLAVDEFSFFVGGKCLPALAKLAPQRELLSARALFAAEASAIEAKGAAAFADTLVKVKWATSGRKPFAGPAPSRVAAPKKGRAGLDGELDRLLAVLRANDPVVFDALVEAKGASSKALAGLRRSIEVPAALDALLARFDGELPMFEYTTLSCAAIAKNVALYQKLSREKKVRWEDEWVPFAADGGGNLLVLDAKGRALQWEIRGHGSYVRAKSLDALVKAAHAELS